MTFTEDIRGLVVGTAKAMIQGASRRGCRADSIRSFDLGQREAQTLFAGDAIRFAKRCMSNGRGSPVGMRFPTVAANAQSTTCRACMRTCATWCKTNAKRMERLRPLACTVDFRLRQSVGNWSHAKDTPLRNCPRFKP